MVAVVLVLLLLGIAGGLLARSIHRVDAAVTAVAAVEPAAWQTASGELRAAAEEVRDAVAVRGPR